MLGRAISDPQHIESGEGSIAGLGLLDTVTTFQPQKTTRQVKARVLVNEGLLKGLQGEEVSGYEIHMGQTETGSVKPLLLTRKGEGQSGHNDGAVADDGLTFGSYLHGLFDNASFRNAFLSGLRQRKGLPLKPARTIDSRQQSYDELAEIVRRSLNMELVYKICGLKS